MKLIRIEQEAIEVTWPFVKDLLDKVIKRNPTEHTLETVKQDLLDGCTQLWVGVENNIGIVLAGTTCFVNYPKEKRLRIILLGAQRNTINSWKKICWEKDSPLLRFAKENGATKVELFGRDGWLKTLFDIGFRKHYIVMTKEI